MGKDLEVLVESKLNMTPQHTLAQKVNILGCINRSTASKLIKVITLLPLAFVTLHLEYDTQFWVLKYKTMIYSNKFSSGPPRLLWG